MKWELARFGEGVTRREFIALSASAAGAAMLVSCGDGDDARDPISVGQDADPTSFFQPQELTPVRGAPGRPGVLDTVLRVEEIPVKATMRNQKGSKKNEVSWKLRAYGYPDPADGGRVRFSIPGPTLRFQRGDRLRMKLKNRMPTRSEDVCDPGSNVFDRFPNCFHGDNHTNVHYHGSHLSPNPRSDFVLLSLPPGRNTNYDFVWPENQAPGTHWYHPHKHGSTALQVGNGLAGALIIEGDFDFQSTKGNDVVRPAELVMVIQELTEKLGFPESTPRLELTINGRHVPTVRMRAGEVQRWRLVNATMRASTYMSLNFEENAGEPSPVARQIARDGVQFADETWKSQQRADVVLAAGNRVDLLVQAPKNVGSHALFSNQLHPIPKNVDATRSDLLLQVEVLLGDPATYFDEMPTSLPELPEFLRDIRDDEIVRRRELTFSQFGAQGGTTDARKVAPPQFTIDGKQFDPRRADHVMVVGTAEEWTIRNTSLIPHPFHIHINPFQVVARSDTNGGRPLDKPWIWQDTIALPVAKDGKPGWVRIRHRFEDYTGTFVLHCHILGHEDRGMMQLLQVAQSPEPIPIPPVAFCSIPAGTTPVLAAPAGEPVTS